MKISRFADLLNRFGCRNMWNCPSQLRCLNSGGPDVSSAPRRFYVLLRLNTSKAWTNRAWNRIEAWNDSTLIIDKSYPTARKRPNLARETTEELGSALLWWESSRLKKPTAWVQKLVFENIIVTCVTKILASGHVIKRPTCLEPDATSSAPIRVRSMWHRAVPQGCARSKIEHTPGGTKVGSCKFNR